MQLAVLERGDLDAVDDDRARARLVEAAIGPARRASRLDVLDALHYE